MNSLLLVVFRGPDRGLVWHSPPGQQAPMDQPVVLGRLNKTIGLSDHGVSRRHALIWFEKDRWMITDNKSSGGTFVNGTQLAGSIWLRSGDRVRVGNTSLAVALVDSETGRTEDQAHSQTHSQTNSQAHGHADAEIPGMQALAMAVAQAGEQAEASDHAEHVVQADQTDQSVHADQEFAAHAHAKTNHDAPDTTDSSETNPAPAPRMMPWRRAAALVMMAGGIGALGVGGYVGYSDRPDAMAARDVVSIWATRVSDRWTNPTPTQTAIDRVAAMVERQAQREDQSFNELQLALREGHTRQSDMLARITEDLDQQSDQQGQATQKLLAAIDQGTQRNDPQLARILDRLQATDENTTTIAKSTDQMREAIVTAITESGLTLGTQLAQGRDATEKLAVVTETMRDDVVTAIADTANRTEPLLAHVATQLEQQREQDLALAADLREAFEHLGNVMTARSDEQGTKLAQIAEMSQTLSVVDQLAARLDTEMARQGGQDQEMVALLQQLVAQDQTESAASEASDTPSPADALLRQLIAVVETQNEQLRTMVDRVDQLDMSNNSALAAVDGFENVGSDGDTVAASLASDQTLTLGTNHIGIDGEGSGAMSGEGGGVFDSVEARALMLGAGRLTRLQQAYRDAFETNLPQLYGGRLLEPNAARRELGVTRWEQWYLVDRFRERQALKQQAAQFHDQRETPVIDYVERLMPPPRTPTQ